MPIVLPNNLDKEPLELVNKITYKHLKKALEEVAKERNMPVQIADDKYDVSDGGLFSSLFAGTIPCIAIYHTKHKKDYHCAIIELKEAYGRFFAYIHMGGISQNQRDINRGNSYAYLRSDGNVGMHRPGLFARLDSVAAKADMQDENLYYDALYKLIGEAIVEAQVMADLPPRTTSAPRPENTQKTINHTAAQQEAPKKETPKSKPAQAAPAPKKPIQPEPHKEPIKAEPRQKLEKSIGIETMGGVFYKIISAGTYIPTEAKMTFSTAADKQTSVEINVLQGENEKACDNVSLGKYMLSGIAPAPRGVPQIEITFSVNKYGELDVTATDKGTGSELEVFVDNILGARTDTEQKKQPEPQQKKEAPPCAKFQFEVSQSDDELFKWMDADICLLTPDGVTIDVFKKHTYVPTNKAITLTVGADEGSSFDIQVLERNKTSVQEQSTLGTISLSKLPYSCDRNLQVELFIYVKSKGQAEATAKLLPSRKYLPIAFSYNHPSAAAEKTAPQQPTPAVKSKVEQLQDLVDLLDRGALTQEEFEILKKKILYN